MRIAIDSRALSDRAGIGRYAENLVKSLVRINGSDEYFLVGIDEPHVPSFGMERVPVGNITSSRSRTTAFEHVHVPKVLRDLGVDVFHAMFTFVPVLAGCRKVFTLHDLTPLTLPQCHRRETVEYLRRWTALYVDAADIVIADSQHTKREIIRFWPSAEEKAFVVLSAASSMFRQRPVCAETRSLLKQWGVEQDYILYVGTLEPRKNVCRIVQAYKLLHDRHGDEVKLILAGEQGWGRDDVRREISQAGLEKSVCVPGRLDDETMVDLYNGCLFFVYPSLYEGFGLPPLEALMCGKAVITSSVTSLPEVAGNAALYVDPTSVEDIWQAMEKLLTDSERRSGLERLAPQQAKRFSWENSARRLKILYRMLQ
jgi:glycosyltransferase involved in cell wall biosynthesis